MTSRPRTAKGLVLARLAVVGAVAAGAPLALAGTAGAAPVEAWDKLARCESGGDWNIDTGNGYYGGIQFNAGTWHAFGGSGMPHQASKEEQIAVAERALAAQGWDAWPACSRKMGLRGYSAQPGGKAAAPAEPTPAEASGGTYTVKRGDTLSKIAAAHGTDAKKLFAVNRDRLSHPDRLSTGLTLHVA